MAGSLKRIRTPLRGHLRQIRYQLVPVVVFLSGICGAALLWNRQAALPNSIGAVETLRARQHPHVKPEVDLIVRVQAGSVPIRSAETRIVQIGPQIELVPLHQLRDPRVPESGLPVRTEIPEKLNLTPGELVDRTYRLAP